MAAVATSSDPVSINPSSASDIEGRLLSSNPEVVREWLQQHSHRKQITLLDKFLQELRHGRLLMQKDEDTRLLSANKTINLLRHMIGSTSWKTAAELLCLLRGLGCELQAAVGPREPALGNIVRRVMAAVREETVREAQEASTDRAATNASTTNEVAGGRLSLQSMMWALPQHVRSSGRHHSSEIHQRQESLASEAEFDKMQVNYPPSYYTTRPNLKQAVLEAIQEIMTDLEDLHRNINEQVTNHIHAQEVILTCGNSKTVELFLKAACAKKQNPSTVIVCGSGYDMACRLAEVGVETTFMEVAAAFAIMPRVHKVILPAHAVLANGGLVTDSGCNLIALAAKQLSVPVICVTGLFKLCPMYPHEGQDTLQDLISPVPSVLSSYEELADPAIDGVEFVNPLHDYIEPKHISLYVTNVGSFQPSFIYRLLAENYHTDDWKSFD